MISHLEFEKLSRAKQFDHIRERGIYLMRKRSGRYIIQLLSVDTFFVEIWKDTNADDIKTITGFSDPQKLNFYLQEVSLPDFFG